VTKDGRAGPLRVLLDFFLRRGGVGLDMMDLCLGRRDNVREREREAEEAMQMVLCD
jgi:hypothetical protein